MEIAIDIGNTNVVIGFFDSGQWIHLMRLITKKDDEAKLFYDLKIREQLLDLDFNIVELEGIYLSSVVPELTDDLSKLITNIFEKDVVVINAQSFKKLKLSIDKPSEIGNDLVANAVSAVTRYKTGCVIVDFGTALTFTVVTGEYEILGVMIAPGLKTAMSALHSKTAQLPEALIELPETVIGKNTIHAIQSGVLWGYVGLVKELLARISMEYDQKLTPIATGGLSSILSPLEDIFSEVDKNLTLDGIRIIGRSTI